jgi:hypothetical protein
MGVIKPYQQLNKRQIEQCADKVLAAMHADKFMPRKWSGLAERTADFFDLGIVWGTFEPGADGIIAAKIHPMEKRVELNEDFQALHKNEGLYQSTVGHEVGHWVLHINPDEAEGAIAQGELFPPQIIDSPIFLCKTVDEQKIYQKVDRTQSDWREWQAQYFSSCLLMPRFKIEEVRKGRNLLNWSHRSAIMEELGVSKRNLVHRLKDLELIEESGHQLYPGKKLKSGEPLLSEGQEFNPYSS